MNELEEKRSARNYWNSLRDREKEHHETEKEVRILFTLEALKSFSLSVEKW